MRVLILNSWYYPNLKGGAEHSVKLLAENLTKRGHSVGVFTIDSDKREIVKESINGVNVYRGSGGVYDIRKAYLPQKPLIDSIKNKLLEIRNYSVIDELDVTCKKFNPDLVHINCIAGMSISVILYFYRKHIPMVYTLRDYFLDNPKNIIEVVTWKHPVKKIFYSLYREYVRRKTNLVDAVTAPSEFTLNHFLNLGFFQKTKYKCCVVNSVTVQKECVEKCIEEKLVRAKRNFMYAGSLTENKGVIPMLKAFMTTSLDSNLYICGTGRLSNYVQECANEDSRIKHLGLLSPVDLEKVYKMSDIMLVPSLWAEPFGRVVIEAAKYGLYVIGSNNGGIPEIIKCLGCGKTCEVSDIEVFRQAMEDAYRKDFSSEFANIKSNIDVYSIRRQIEKFENIYKQLL